MQIITGIILVVYLSFIFLFNYWQKKKGKISNYPHEKMPLWKASFYLSALTLTGSTTFGFAGDTIQFGYTYLFWFPLSVFVGWTVTSLVFAKKFYKFKGMTIPSILSKNLGKKVHVITSLVIVIFLFFILIISTFTLASIIKFLFPALPEFYSYIFGFLLNISGLIISKTSRNIEVSIIHSLFIFTSIILGVALLFFNSEASWTDSISEIPKIAMNLNGGKVSETMWLSMFGMGAGVISQFILGEIGIIGSMSTTSFIAASCKTERDARRSFILCGLYSIIPITLSGILGIYSGAILGDKILNIPIYSAIGMALETINPIIAGLVITSFVAAIVSAFAPIIADILQVIITDVCGGLFRINKKNKSLLQAILIIVLGSLVVAFLSFIKIHHIIDFMYHTTHPSMIPITITTVFFLYSKKISSNIAFFAILMGSTLSLFWHFILHNPFGIPNIAIAYFIPIIILSTSVIIAKIKERATQKRMVI